MILSFKKEFEPLITSGSKIHTIREDKPNRWKKDRCIHFATGVRTKHYNQFKKGVCVSVQDIEVLPSKNVDEFTIYIDGNRACLTQMVTLAKNDGFKNLHEFSRFFKDGVKGKIIHWTNHNY